jgi:hypothetical protein
MKDITENDDTLFYICNNLVLKNVYNSRIHSLSRFKIIKSSGRSDSSTRICELINKPIYLCKSSARIHALLASQILEDITSLPQIREQSLDEFGLSLTSVNEREIYVPPASHFSRTGNINSSDSSSKCYWQVSIY